MSTHCLACWPALPADEPPRALRSRLGWCAAVAVLAPCIVLAVAASIAGLATERVRARTRPAAGGSTSWSCFTLDDLSLVQPP